MDVVILAGGEGERLRPLTLHLPKILLPICNQPLLLHILRSLPPQLVDRVILSLGWLAEKVLPFLPFLCGEFKIEVKVEKEKLDTGGAIKLADPQSEDFLVINGDIIADVDYENFLAFHKLKKADLSILTVKVEDLSSFGSVLFTGDMRVRDFREKEGYKRAGFANGGIYILNRRVLQHFPPGRISLEREILPLLIQKTFRVHAFLHFGYWLDVGDRERFLRVHRDALDNIAPLDVSPHPDNILLGSNCSIAEGAEISPYTVIGDNVEIKGKAKLEESVILNGARIKEGAFVYRSIIGPKAVIGKGDRIWEEIKC